MTYRMNRVQWILSGLVALLVVLVAGFTFLVHTGQSMERTENKEAGEFGAATFTPTPPATAREHYEAALPTARAWAEDAQLRRAQATWSPGSDLHVAAPSWNYTFYSSSRQATALVKADRHGVHLLRTRPALETPDLVAIEAWQIDSRAAFELLYESGGEAFLTVHPQRTMVLTLQADEPLRWQIDLIDEGAIGNAAGKQMLRLAFSATDGELIASRLQGDTNGAN